MHMFSRKNDIVLVYRQCELRHRVYNVFTINSRYLPKHSHQVASSYYFPSNDPSMFSSSVDKSTHPIDVITLLSMQPTRDLSMSICDMINAEFIGAFYLNTQHTTPVTSTHPVLGWNSNLFRLQLFGYPEVTRNLTSDTAQEPPQLNSLWCRITLYSLSLNSYTAMDCLSHSHKLITQLEYTFDKNLSHEISKHNTVENSAPIPARWVNSGSSPKV